MSYDIYIRDKKTGEVIKSPTGKHHLRGGTYKIGGDEELHLNITYNYSKFYYRADTLGESTVERRDTGKGWLEEVKPELNGIPGLARLTIPQARIKVFHAIEHMHGTPSPKYWDATEGNAKLALIDLLTLLNLAPDDAVITIE